MAIALVMLSIAAACATSAPWVARSDLVEIALLGEAIAIDVTANDTIPASARLTSVVTTSPDLEAVAESTGVITVRSLGGAVGDEHRVRYRLTENERSTDGTLIVRVVSSPSVPRLVVEPTEVDFGTVPVGSVSLRRVGVAVTGTLGETYPVTVDPVTGLSHSIDAQPCAALTEQQPCELTVDWSPNEAGDLQGSFVIRAGEMEPVTVTLRGTATTANAAAFDVSPATIDFETAFVDDLAPTLDVTIHNTGTTMISPDLVRLPQAVSASLDGCAAIAAGDACRFVVSLDTRQVVDVNGVLVISAGAATVSRNVSGRVIEQPPRVRSFDLTPADITISGEAGRRTINIENTGDAPLDDFQVTGRPDWLTPSISSDCFPLPVDRSCVLTLDYERDDRIPTENLGISVESGDLVRQVTLVLEPLTRSFVLEPTAITLTVENPSESIVVTNDGDITLTSVTLPADSDSIAFRNDTCEMPLAPAAQCAFTVDLTRAPAAEGPTGSIPPFTVFADEIERTLEVAIDISPPPEFELEPAEIVLTDEGEFETITVSNTGDVALDGLVFEGLSGFGSDGDGMLSVPANGCAAPVGPGRRCTFDVRLDAFANSRPAAVDILVVSDGVERPVTVRMFVVR